jgi:MFS family permease
MFNVQQKKLLLLSGLGGILEFYDFIIYALFAGTIAKAFFPLTNSAASLMAAFGTFFIGYLVRPLGGIFFGHYGDRFGRKKTFTLSILMMAFSTLFIGLIPPYSSIGIIAPIIVTLLRIIQGLSVGGEIPGAIAYVSESFPAQKGLTCSVVFACLIFGIVLGSFVQAIITSLTTDAQMQQFGWRIAFIVGGIFGFGSFWMRRSLQESPLFKAIQNKTEKFPLHTVFKKASPQTVLGIFITALGAVIITVLFLFTPTYFSKVLFIPKNSAYLWYNTGGILLSALICIPFGILSDKIQPNQIKTLLYILILSTLILAYPIFYIYTHQLNLSFIAFGVSSILTGFAWGIIPRVLSELFPTEIRYSGVALSYNVGFALFGGLTPLITLYLIYKSSAVAPAYYLIAISLICFFALCYYRTKEIC